jgi:hypothetical protein
MQSSVFKFLRQVFSVGVDFRNRSTQPLLVQVSSPNDCVALVRTL